MIRNSRLERAAVSSAVALVLFGTSAAYAEPLSYSREPLANAVAGLSHKLGVTFVIKQGISSRSLVTIDLANIDADGSRLLAASQLANAVGGDYQKVFVVSKSESSDSVQDPQIDSGATITFTSATMPAEQALQDIANADFAAVRGSAALSGNVTFSGTELTVAKAAAEFAQQTHTKWKAFYALVPRGAAGNQFGSKIIDHTAGGRPIYQLPIAVWTSPKPAPVQQPDDTSASANGGADTTYNAGIDNNGQYPASYGGYNQNGPYDFTGNGYGYGNGYPGGGYGQGYGYPMGGYSSPGLTILPQNQQYGGYPTYVFP